MKNLNFFPPVTVIILSFVLVTSACSKHDDNKVSPAETEKGSVTADIIVNDSSSKAFSSTGSNITAVMAVDTLALKIIDDKTGTVLVIMGYPMGTTECFPFSQGDSQDRVATMDWDGSTLPQDQFICVGNTDNDDILGGNGTFCISSLTDNHIKGTFSITMFNGMQQKAIVSNGKIDCDLFRDK